VKNTDSRVEEIVHEVIVHNRHSAYKEMNWEEIKERMRGGL